MYIIRKNAYENGARPAIQTWTNNIIPNDYAICPEEFIDIFYSTDPAGFVNITIDNNIVTSMEINQEAYDAYISLLTPIEPAPEEDVIEDVSYDVLAQAITEGVNDL